jgi:transcriptional regulator with XRE-family HTH domain
MTSQKNRKSLIEDLNIGGEIRKIRKEKGYTLKELSQKTGFSTALLSQIENNVVSPPISTLWRIANALEVRLAHFFQQTPINREDYFIVRKGKGRLMTREESQMVLTYESLGYGKEDRTIEPFIVHFGGEEERDAQDPLSHTGEEFLYVLKGKIYMEYGDQRFVLEPGDSILFESVVSHRLHGEKESAALAVVYRGRKKTEPKKS